MIKKDENGRRILPSGEPRYPREKAALYARDWPALSMAYTRLADKWDAQYEVEQARLAQKTPKKDRPSCGARCRDGHPCQARVVEGRRRCRQHGGLSTGPRTTEGRHRIAESNRARGGKGKAGAADHEPAALKVSEPKQR